MLLRIVIFDQDVESLDTLNYILSRQGHEVLCFAEPCICPIYTNNSCQCSQQNACVDILLIENKMSKMSGLDFVRQQSIRGCKGVVRNKAIMSANWSPEEIEIAKTLGIKLFTKPIDFQQLFRWLGECQRKIVPYRTLASLAI